MHHHPLHAHVTGATSQIGYYLLPRLQQAGFHVTAYSRHPQSNTTSIVWQQQDLTTQPLRLTQPSILFHCAGIPLLPHILANLPDNAPLQRVLAFSSTSALSKQTSADAEERAIAMQLHQTEQASIDYCNQHQIAWTLFRPTLIYGCGRDQNVTFIARFIQRWGFFPVFGAALGLRQPVHADDLAQACLQAWNNNTTHAQIYTLSGGETLSYRAMLTTIFEYLDRKPRIITVPLPLLQLSLFVLRVLPRFRHLNSTMARRMNQNLVYDHHAAQRDFAYQARAFRGSELGVL